MGGEPVSPPTDRGEAGEGEAGSTAEWPVELRGVTETVVATLGPNDRWNHAALGVHAGEPATATTWGRTRTWRNVRERGSGVIQFVADPVTFVDAALSIHETDHPRLDAADAWVEVEVECVSSGTDGGTQWVRWALDPRASGVERTSVRTLNRGTAAVIEATVAASRLDVDAYDTETLRDRLAYFAETTHRCGGERDRRAFDRLLAHADLSAAALGIEPF